MTRPLRDNLHWCTSSVDMDHDTHSTTVLDIGIEGGRRKAQAAGGGAWRGSEEGRKLRPDTLSIGGGGLTGGKKRHRHLLPPHHNLHAQWLARPCNGVTPSKPFARLAPTVKECLHLALEGDEEALSHHGKHRWSCAVCITCAVRHACLFWTQGTSHVCLFPHASIQCIVPPDTQAHCPYLNPKP